MIYRQEIYADDEGRAIHAKIPISIDAPEYLGIGNVQDSFGQIVQFEFVVPGQSVKEAFDNFDAAREPAHADCCKQIAAKEKADRQARSTPKIAKASSGAIPIRRS